MAKPAPPVSTEEMPIDEACASGAAALWAGYQAAAAAARGLDELRRMMPLALSADEERRLAAYSKARAALAAWLADRSERGEIGLWARPGSRIEGQKRIPPAAVRVLEFDYEERTARGKGLPLLYDVLVRQACGRRVRVRQAAGANPSIKRWRKRPPADVLKAATLAVAKTFRSSDPPTEATWWKALNAKFDEPVTRKVARDALTNWASHLKRHPGQTRRNRRG
jgi:hypothetical protein